MICEICNTDELNIVALQTISRKAAMLLPNLFGALSNGYIKKANKLKEESKKELTTDSLTVDLQAINLSLGGSVAPIPSTVPTINPVVENVASTETSVPQEEVKVVNSNPEITTKPADVPTLEIDASGKIYEFASISEMYKTASLNGNQPLMIKPTFKEKIYSIYNKNANVFDPKKAIDLYLELENKRRKKIASMKKEQKEVEELQTTMMGLVRDNKLTQDMIQTVMLSKEEIQNELNKMEAEQQKVA